jgi:hypothetical protein
VLLLGFKKCSESWNRLHAFSGRWFKVSVSERVLRKRVKTREKVCCVEDALNMPSHFPCLCVGWGPTRRGASCRTQRQRDSGSRADHGGASKRLGDAGEKGILSGRVDMEGDDNETVRKTEDLEGGWMLIMKGMRDGGKKKQEGFGREVPQAKGERKRRKRGIGGHVGVQWIQPHCGRLRQRGGCLLKQPGGGGGAGASAGARPVWP